jgi:hypothetical protein
VRQLGLNAAVMMRMMAMMMKVPLCHAMRWLRVQRMHPATASVGGAAALVREVLRRAAAAAHALQGGETTFV